MSKDVAKIMEDAQDQRVAMLPFVMPISVFKMLHEVAYEEGITVPNLMTRALQKELERIEALKSQEG